MQTTQLHTPETHPISITDIIGMDSMLLILLAILIGISSLIIRNHKYSLFAMCLEIAFAFMGLGLTFWGLSSFNRTQTFDSIGIEPSSWFANFSFATARAGSVLPACAIGMILVGISFLLTKSKPIKPENKIQ